MYLERCPLCDSEAIDKSYGIECTGCGLWLGANSKLPKPYKEVWNDRHIYTEEQLNQMEKDYEARKEII